MKVYADSQDDLKTTFLRELVNDHQGNQGSLQQFEAQVQNEKWGPQIRKQRPLRASAPAFTIIFFITSTGVRLVVLVRGSE